MKDIKLLILDIDGTLTDGKIYIDNNGNEMKSFNVKDGLAISKLIKYGLECAIITGRKSNIVEYRSKELGIKYVYQKVTNKLDTIEMILKDLKISFNNCAYIGDDINDLEAIKNVRFSACPSDAVYEVKENCDFVSKFKGGEGAVREIIEYIFKERNEWSNIIMDYTCNNQ